MLTIVTGIVCFLSVVAMFCFRKYKKDEISHFKLSQNPVIACCYPMAYCIMEKFGIIPVFMKKSRRADAITRLAVGKEKKQAVTEFLLPWFAGILAGILVGIFCVFLGSLLPADGVRMEQGNRLLRPKVNEGSETVTVIVRLKENERVLEEEVALRIREEALTKEEFLKETLKVKEVLEKAVKGENERNEKITMPLNLITSVEGSPLRITWKIPGNLPVHPDGTLEDDIAKEGESGTICAVISYGEWETEHEMNYTFFPESLSWEEENRKLLNQMLVAADEQTSTASFYLLPSEIEGKEISYRIPEDKKGAGILLIVVISGVVISIYYLELPDRKMKLREKEIMLDYSEIVNQFALLLGAGMTIRKAWERMVTEYRRKGKHRYAYEEMALTLREMENGVSESKAIESFGIRMGVMAYLKFTTLMVQNMKKGTKDLLSMLEYEAGNALYERREAAKSIGKEAETKLLFPMLMMMGIVFAILMVPAFMNF